MAEFFAGLGVEAAAQITFTGMLLTILGLVIRAIVKGDLITKTQHDREMGDLRAQLTKAWEVASAESARADVVSDQNAQLIVGSKTALDAIEALRAVAQQRALEAE